MPVIGDEVETDGLLLYVMSVEGHRVKRVRVTVIEREPDDEELLAGVYSNGHTNGNGNGSANASPQRNQRRA